MTRDDFASALTPLVRHGLTAVAGVLAAHGIADANSLIPDFTAAGTLLVATLAWSFVEKSKLVSAALGELPVSTLEQVAHQVIELRKNGADPLLVAHIAQAVTAVANSELATARPDLVPGAVVVPQAGAVPPQPSVTSDPPVSVPVAPETPPAPVSPEPVPVEQAPSAPVLADGSMPS